MLFFFFAKQATLMRRSTVAEPSPSVSIPCLNLRMMRRVLYRLETIVGLICFFRLQWPVL